MQGPAKWFFPNVTANFPFPRNARITQVRIVNPSERDASKVRYSFSLVNNTGAFDAKAWISYGVDHHTIRRQLQNDTRRLISIDPYYNTTAKSIRYNIILVDNQGANQKKTWWYAAINDTDLETFLNTSPPKRAIEVLPIPTIGTRYFAAIIIANTGADALDSQWVYGKSFQEIDDLAGKTRRVATLAPDYLGGYDAIIVNNTDTTSGKTYWWFSRSGEKCQEAISKYNTRLIDFSVREDGNYTCVEVPNSYPPQSSEI